MTVEISSAVLARILSLGEASPGLEVCGLLFGTSDRIHAIRPCRNVAPEPATRFEIDPAALIAAYRTERGGGVPIVGCYHSHPSGDTEPSVRDAAAAEPNGWVWLIVGGDRVSAYRADAQGALHGRFDRLDLRPAPDA